MKKVCVIGAGPSGLTTIKQLLDEGHRPVCYEKEDDIGGVFNYGNDKNGVYDNTVLTISNYLMCFSDYPPQGARYFWPHSEYKQYLIEYAETFNLLPHIHFSTKLLKMKKHGDGYEVTLQNRNTQEVYCEYFDAVAICTGTHQIKKIPQIAGLDGFAGELMHSSDYKSNDKFVGKNVVCIGLGESSADITREISDAAQHCYLSIRSYPYLIPRILNRSAADGWTSRMLHTTYHPSERIGYYLIAYILFYLRSFWRICRNLFRPKQSFKPPFDPFGQPTDPKMLDLRTEYGDEALKLIKAWSLLSGGNKFATKNVTFVPNILNGKIQVNASGIKRVEGHTVLFNDGRSVSADVIVACTGYQDNFDFIEGFHLADNNVRNLFMHAFHPDLPNCAFIGWARPITGGIPACSEMAARFFALLLSDNVTLPDNIEALIEEDKAFYAKAVCDSPTLNTVVSWKRYMENFAKLIDCQVTLWKYLSNPLLFMKLMYGSLIPAQYRLEGPHANRELAKRTILRLPITTPFTLGRNVSKLAIRSKLGLNKADVSSNDEFVKYEYFPDCALTDQDIARFRYVSNLAKAQQ